MLVTAHLKNIPSIFIPSKTSSSPKIERERYGSIYQVRTSEFNGYFPVSGGHSLTICKGYVNLNNVTSAIPYECDIIDIHITRCPGPSPFNYVQKKKILWKSPCVNALQ
jgi:hypothetical protein